jgi:membrane associated rhomboid family serine protease
VISVAALSSPALMQLFTRDLPRLRAGQWWRVVTPLLVQPSGWGQVVFNLLGIAVVGAALQRRFGWVSWSTVYLAGGAGSIAVYSAWHPADTGGGASAAVAALIGAFIVARNVSVIVPVNVSANAVTNIEASLDGWSGRLEWLAQLYAVFFAVYLTALDLGGVWASIVAGNLSLIVMCAARRAVGPLILARTSLLVAIAAGFAMTIARDDHGVGLAVGGTLAAVVLARRRVLSRPAPSRRRQTAVAVPGVVAAAWLTWLGWVELLGVPLVARPPHGRAFPVTGGSVALVAAAACLAASAALRLLRRHAPARGVRLWTGLCLGTALRSVTGPLALAVGTAGVAALISLHVVCAAAILALLAPPGARPRLGPPRPGDRPPARALR